MIVDYLKFADVPMPLHDAQELDNDLGRGSDGDLALSTALGVVQAIVQNRHADHLILIVGSESVRLSGTSRKRVWVS